MRVTRGTMMQDPLAGLHDIHMPEPVSWWPPAPGWWLLLALILLGMAALFWWLKKCRHRQAKAQQFSRRNIVKEALAELERLDGLAAAGADTGALATELSALLRRVAIAMHADDDARIAGLSGDDWLNWLDEQWDEHGFSDGVGRQLLDAPYQRHGQIDMSPLLVLVRCWTLAQR
ncbi:MAG: DUF4381 domain-containing protein [Mariprofundaceae bacterium]|nr:DUF4381 domain-containing protein [Mariprofundaceae bacterium]